LTKLQIGNFFETQCSRQHAVTDLIDEEMCCRETVRRTLEYN